VRASYLIVRLTVVTKEPASIVKKTPSFVRNILRLSKITDMIMVVTGHLQEV